MANQNNVCRTCLKNNDLVELFPSDENLLNKNKEIVTAIKDFYNFTITKNDEYSTLVCKACIRLLNIFLNARRYASFADYYLRNCSSDPLLSSALAQVSEEDPKDVSLKEDAIRIETEACSNEKETELPIEKKEIGTVINVKNILDPTSKRKKKTCLQAEPSSSQKGKNTPDKKSKKSAKSPKCDILPNEDLEDASQKEKDEGEKDQGKI